MENAGAEKRKITSCTVHLVQFSLRLCCCCADPLETMQEVMDGTQWGPDCVYRRVEHMTHGEFLPPLTGLESRVVEAPLLQEGTALGTACTAWTSCCCALLLVVVWQALQDCFIHLPTPAQPAIGCSGCCFCTSACLLQATVVRVASLMTQKWSRLSVKHWQPLHSSWTSS